MNPELVKKIAIGAGVVGTVVVVSVVLTKKACDRAHKAFMEKHDEQMANELTKAFKEAIDAIPFEIKRSTGKFKERVNEICAQPRFNIAPVFA